MNRNLNLLTIYTVLMNSVFLLPIIVPFYRDELGLTFHQFLMGEAVFAAVVLLLEVPSGWFADIWGRRSALIASSAFAFLGYAIVASASGFWVATLGQAFIGVAVSLHSGTLSAFLYDTLLSQGREDEYRKREGFRHGLCLYSVAGAAIIGGLLYQVHHYAPIFLEMMFVAGAIIVGCFLQEPPRHKMEIQKSPLHDIKETVLFALHGHKDIGLLILFVALIFGSTKVFLWAQQPYYGDLGTPESVYGFLMAAAMMAGGLGGHLGHHVLRNWQGLAVVKVLWLVVIATCAIAGATLSYPGLALIMLGSLIWGFGWPRVQETINHAVGSERRATILSTCSLMYSLAFIPFSLLLGWIEEGRSITDALLVHGGLIAVIGCVFLVWAAQKRRVSV